MTKFMKLLPAYWQDSLEMKELQEALGDKVDELADVIDSAYLDTRIMTASAERLTEWETDIGLASEGRTLDQRRKFILSLLRGSGKLNEAKINNIVNTFTGGTAVSVVRDGTLTVTITPPSLGETYLFPDVENALSVRVPAHLELKVVRHYSTWEDIRKTASSWGDLRTSFSNWAAVKNYIKE